MRYEFPHIEHIDQVKAVIKDRPEFIVAEREHFDIVNYLVVMPNTFPLVDSEEAAILRECRGLIFDKKGKILSRRFHKFFNVNEREETLSNAIDLSNGHVIMDKMDGSMVTPIWIEAHNGFRWGTKMGISDVALQAEGFVARHQNYNALAFVCCVLGATPIFEYCSRYNKIVVDYSEEQMILLAIRDNITGRYWNVDEYREVLVKYSIPVVKVYDTGLDIEQLIADTRKQENTEGYIIRFDDGHMLKIKTDWYVTIHRAKDNLLHEKNIIKMILNNETDDVKPHLPEDDRNRLIDFEKEFWSGFNAFALSLEDQFYAYSLTMDRKEFAQTVAKKHDSITVGLMFKMFDGKDIKTMMIDIISRHLGSKTQVETVRHLWCNKKWEVNVEIV